jgi:hypothetical protein
MNCEVKGLTFFHGDDGRRGFVNVALATIDFPELRLQLEGVRLTHSDKGWRALPPVAQIRGSSGSAIYWRSGSPLADAACKAMLAMYEKMGGPKPEAVVNNVSAKRRIAERKARAEPVPYRTIEQIDAAMPMAEMGLSIDAGLARTLGV